MKSIEAQEQTALFEWANIYSNIYPDLELMFHVPNGGSRNKIEAANLKKQGVKAGVPDICLPVARGNYHGMYIEMKVGKNIPTDKQDKWLFNLNKQGYAVKVCYTWTEAADAIMKYMEM